MTYVYTNIESFFHPYNLLPTIQLLFEKQLMKNNGKVIKGY